MKIHNALLFFQFVAIATMNGYGVFSNREFHATNNNGFCCTSDNVKHDACVVSTGGLANRQVDFKITDCKTKCSNDAFCKGYSIETVTTMGPITTSYDICYLYTTAKTTELCSFDQPKNPNFPTNPPTSDEQIDDNTKCNDLRIIPPGVTSDFHEGCQIKIKDSGCHCKDECIKNPEFFNGEPYCHVNSESSCPDRTHFTSNFAPPTLNTVSAEACKKFPNDYGFVRHEGSICSHEPDNELQSFTDFNDSSLSHHNARDECEQYCLDKLDCWGCTFHCDNECKWIAVTECKTIKTNRFDRRGATQKPVCFDIRTINGEAENYKYETWNIGACSKAISGNTEPGPNNEGYIINIANRPYDYTIQRCCLSPKTYDLTCRDTFEKEMDGWNGGAIEIQGHKYCDDFVEKSVKRKVAIQASNILTAIPNNGEKKESNYIKIDGEECTRIGEDDYTTEDEARAACSSHDYCIGFVEKKSECYEGWHLRKNMYGLCFNKGNRPFTNEDIMGNSRGQECVVYKKRVSESSPQMQLIPAAEALTERLSWPVVASDYSCPNGAKPFVLNSHGQENLGRVFITCHCEDHCNWYKCRLEKPPLSCLDEEKSFWQWDDRGSYWVAQMRSRKIMGNSSIDSGLTDDGDERNMNLVSMDVERKGIRSNLNRSKSKSSNTEPYETVAMIVLCLIFLLFVFTYFGRAPRKVFSNKEILTTNIKKIFTVLCALIAIYMIMTQVVKYLDNNDASSIHYKEFNKDRNNKYPTFSICFEGEKFYYKNFEDPLFESFGMNSLQYSNALKGRPSYVSKYNPSKKMYEKVPRNFKDVANINFNQLVYNLSDVVSGLDLVAYNANHTKHYPEALKQSGLKKYSFKLTYQTWNERCFTRISDDEDGARRKFDFLSMRYSILNDKLFEGTEFKLIVHYPGQMIRSMHKPGLTVSFNELTSQMGGLKIKLRELFIQQVTVLKKRKNSNQPCNDKIVDDDAKFINEVIKKAGCIPVYLKLLSSQALKYEECRSQEQLSNVYEILGDYKDALRSYNPPCIDMSVVLRDQHNQPLKNQHQEIDIKLIYNEGKYQEIVNTRDFGMDNFWISVGGFVGLFLGYSLSQISELFVRIPDLFRKRKEG